MSSGHQARDGVQTNSRRINGIYLQTFDAERPELYFKTSSEKGCKRWEVVLGNIDSERTAID